MLKKYKNLFTPLCERQLKAIKGGVASSSGNYYCDRYFPCPFTCQDQSGGPAYECRDYICVYVFCGINPG